MCSLFLPRGIYRLFGMSANEDDTLCSQMFIYLLICYVLSDGLSNKAECHCDASDCLVHP